MAPLETNFDGFWGKTTATIDWCEANYEVTYYIAEFCELFDLQRWCHLIVVLCCVSGR